MRYMLAALWAVFLCLPVNAGETRTTWRAGDVIPPVPFYCTSHEAAANLAIAATTEAVANLYQSGECVQIHPMIRMYSPPVELGRLLSHHIEPMTKKAISVWQSDDMFFLLTDETGPHKADSAT